MAKGFSIASILSSDNTNAISLQSVTSLYRFLLNPPTLNSLGFFYVTNGRPFYEHCAFQTIELEPGIEMTRAKAHFSFRTVVIRGITLQAGDSQGNYFTAFSANHGGCGLWGLR
jgi:hypothetical protein